MKDLQQRAGITRVLLTHWLVAVLLLATAMPACAQRQAQTATIPADPGGFNMYSRDQDVEIGRQVAAEVEKQVPLLPDNHPLSVYVRQLGERLAAHTPDPHYPYTFKVVNQREINAFALPGGPVYLHVGIITAAGNEGEIAGVLGHEIAHVVMRHGTRQASRGGALQLGAAILGGVLGGGVGGTLAQLGGSLAGGVFMLSYSREYEREADRVGARLLYEANYNPQAVVTFFRKLEEQSGGGGGPAWLSSHPSPGNRAQLAAEAISGLPPKDYRTDTQAFQRAKAEAGKLKPLSAEEVAQQQKQQQPQTGQVSPVSRTDITPSRNLRTLEHNAFQIRHPENWQVVSGDRSSPVAIAPPAGVAGNAIAYGVMISAFRPEGRMNLNQATQALIQDLQKANPQLRPVGSARNMRVNNVAARSVDLLNQSPIQGERERDWLVTMFRPDGSVLYIIFISTERDFDQLRPAFEEMLRSLHLRG